MAAEEKHKRYARLARRATLHRYSPGNSGPTARVAITVDYEAVWSWLAQKNEGRDKPERVTMTHVLMKALGLALRNYIYFNYAYTGGRKLHPVKEIDIRTPVDLLDYPQFLVVRSCDSQSIDEIAKEFRARRAAIDDPAPTPLERILNFFALPGPVLSALLALLTTVRFFQRFIPGAEARGLERQRRWMGSFMLTNPGTGGAELATGVVTRPAIAYVVAGAAKKRPVVNAEGAVEVRRQGLLICDFDHRFIDGGQAVRLLNEMKRNLEAPEEYLHLNEAPSMHPGTIGGVPP